MYIYYKQPLQPTTLIRWILARTSKCTIGRARLSIRDENRILWGKRGESRAAINKVWHLRITHLSGVLLRSDKCSHEQVDPKGFRATLLSYW